MLFITNLLRAFNATSDSVLDALQVEGSAIGSGAMNQEVFKAPSVFNSIRPLPGCLEKPACWAAVCDLLFTDLFAA